MKSILVAVALFVTAALAQFTVNTPANVVQCQPTLISWSGGTAPYYVSIHYGSTPDATPLESFPSTTSTSVTWTVNLAANTNIGITVRDGSGALAQTASFTILTGSSTSCTNTTSLVFGPTDGSASGGATATGASTGGATGTSGASTPTASKSGALANVAPFGVTGIVGAVAAVLFI